MARKPAKHRKGQLVLARTGRPRWGRGFQQRVVPMATQRSTRRVPTRVWLEAE